MELGSWIGTLLVSRDGSRDTRCFSNLGLDSVPAFCVLHISKFRSVNACKMSVRTKNAVVIAAGINRRTLP